MPVIIVGAGPVGLTFALTLANGGVPVIVLEKRDALSAASKASTFHPPTLAILDHLGVLSEVFDRGAVVDRIQYRTARDGVFAEFALGALRDEARFPFRLHLEQAAITPVLLARLRAHAHADVRFAVEFESVESGDAGVIVHAREGGSTRTFSGAWLIGADGSRSQVRSTLGIAFDGDDYPEKILRVMTGDNLDPVLPGIAPLTYLYNDGRSASFLRMSDCWRIILRVPREVDDTLALSPGWILERLREASPAFDHLPHVVAKDIYGVSKRVAGRYHVGRSCLAGDSAHVTNTRGGMNMNCGIHDAFGIARAMIAAIARGRPELVRAAADERRRVATEFLIPRTDRTVAGGVAWLAQVKEVSMDRERALDYLRSTAMMDMVPSPGDPLYRPR